LELVFPSLGISSYRPASTRASAAGTTATATAAAAATTDNNLPFAKEFPALGWGNFDGRRRKMSFFVRPSVPTFSFVYHGGTFPSIFGCIPDLGFDDLNQSIIVIVTATTAAAVVVIIIFVVVAVVVSNDIGNTIPRYTGR